MFTELRSVAKIEKRRWWTVNDIATPPLAHIIPSSDFSQSFFSLLSLRSNWDTSRANVTCCDSTSVVCLTLQTRHIDVYIYQGTMSLASYGTRQLNGWTRSILSNIRQRSLLPCFQSSKTRRYQWDLLSNIVIFCDVSTHSALSATCRLGVKVSVARVNHISLWRLSSEILWCRTLCYHNIIFY